jgi:hypothetical protein
VGLQDLRHQQAGGSSVPRKIKATAAGMLALPVIGFADVLAVVFDCELQCEKLLATAAISVKIAALGAAGAGFFAMGGMCEKSLQGRRRCRMKYNAD